jgi:spore coat protein U-like protein
MKNHVNQILAAFSVALLSVSAFAADSEATMGVSASISAECSVGNTKPLAFGALSMLNTNGAQSTLPSASISGGTFDAICTAGTSNPKLKFHSDNTSGSDFRLVGTTDGAFIVYTLTEADGTTAIVHNQAAAFGGFTADGTAKTDLTILGKIAPAAKNGKAAQEYTDTITITTSFDI